MSSEVAERVLLKGWIDRKGGSLMSPWMKRFVVLTTCKVEVYKDDHCNGLKTRMIIDSTARVIVLSAPPVASTTTTTSSSSSSSSTIASSNPFSMLKGSSSSSSYQSTSYRFCLQTSTELLELSADSLELRNEWLGHLVGVVARKSELGRFVSTVRSETDYRLVRAWEASVVSQSISDCSGLVLLPPIETTTSTTTTPSAATAQIPSSSGLPAATTTTTTVGGSTPVSVSSHSMSSSHSYAGFLPFEKWEERFEPETVRLRMEKERGELQ